ncbi:hypothetical protein MMC13_003659 [Lambiella insularis]|nr:hypothetical protein [Lambiella insularis]
MFSSLIPPLAPYDAHTLWSPSLSTQPSQSPPVPATNPALSHTRTHQQHRTSHPTPPARTVLSILRADEAAIELRKANIRRFGAGWLKPPGVAKTLQGMIDEKAEREEQEANGLRELEALDQARLLEEQGAAGDTDAGLLGDDDSEAEEHERDLDQDIPDAEEEHEWIDDEADDGLPSAEGEGDYADEEGIDLDGGTQGRDLDDDVPEAGSYQHTDTDVEDESSDLEVVGGRESFPGLVVANSGAALESSIFGGSSPAMPPQSRAAERRGVNDYQQRRGREN